MANLRDKGYPQSRSYIPNRSDKKTTVMTNSIPVEFLSDPEYVKPEMTYTPREKLLQRLVTAYNNKAYGDSNAPLLKLGHEEYPETSQLDTYMLADDRDGHRLGYLGKMVTDASTIYKAMLDNGNVNRGNLEATLRTPAGDFTGGYDQDTNYAQYTSPNRIENYPGLNLYYAGDNVSPKELNISTGRNDAGGRDIAAFLTGLPIKETTYNEINTPLGVLGYGKNAQDEVNDGSVYGDFTPNEYIQALMNLLGKR